MTIGIIGAMDEELKILCSKLQNREDVTIGAYSFFKGTLRGKDVILAKSGIGKVRAGSVCATLINTFKVDAILNTGSAGAISSELDIGDTVFSQKVAYHDVDLTVFGYQQGQLPGYKQYFIADSNLLEKAREASKKVQDCRVFSGTIVSGDQFIASKEKTIGFASVFENAMVCEMEGAAVAQVCTDFNIPFLIIRAASDRADGASPVSFEDFLPIASKNSALLVEELVALL